MEFEVETGVQGESNYSGTIKLTDDIYVSTGSTMPNANDFRQTLEAIVASKPSNLFRIERGQWNGMTMNVTLDLNDHNIYSDAHVVIGAEVHGKGALVSRGKLAYIYGIESDDLVSISGDDLLVETSGTRDSYYINGVLYSQDDTTIKPLNIDGVLAGNGDGKTRRFSTYPPKVNEDDPEPVKLHDGVLEMYFPGKKGGSVTVFRSGTDPDYTYRVPPGTTFNYNDTDYTLKGELRISESGSPELYITAPDPEDPNNTIWKKTTADDPNGIAPPIGEAGLGDVSKVIKYNYDKMTGDVTVAGTVIGLNTHTANDSDNGGNDYSLKLLCYLCFNSCCSCFCFFHSSFETVEIIYFCFQLRSKILFCKNMYLTFCKSYSIELNLLFLFTVFYGFYKGFSSRLNFFFSKLFIFLTHFSRPEVHSFFAHFSHLSHKITSFFYVLSYY